MTSNTRNPQGLEKSLKLLSISSMSKPKANQTPVAESWEEGADSSSSSTSTETPSNPSTPVGHETPGPPPPTPISPTSRHGRHKSTEWTVLGNSKTLPPTSNLASSPASSPTNSSTTRGSAQVSDKRPEKSNAAAGRMIAGALGVKVPKKSEENKAYERAVKDQERKRRDKVREEDEKSARESEEAKKAVWDD